MELQGKILEAKEKLLERRSGRVRPGLDDKCLTAWNAMAIKGLVDCASVFDNEEYYELSSKAANFILSDLKTESGGIYRNFKSGTKSISGFLDDYAFLIDALIALYEFDFDERWLQEANDLATYVIANFEDAELPMFFTPQKKGTL